MTKTKAKQRVSQISNCHFYYFLCMGVRKGGSVGGWGFHGLGVIVFGIPPKFNVTNFLFSPFTFFVHLLKVTLFVGKVNI